LRRLIRSENDGYLPDKHDPRLEAGIQSVSKDINLNELQKAAGISSKLVVQVARQEIPQAVAFDLKTRSARKEVDIEEFLPACGLIRSRNSPSLITSKQVQQH
jgi:hypothetical protein